jgi:mono/diheme cytochrome c family protein
MKKLPMPFRVKNSPIFPAILRTTLLAVASGFFLFSCSSGAKEGAATEAGQSDTAQTEAPAAAATPADEGRGFGPIKTVALGETIDQVLADSGKAAFESKCTACHKFGERYVGPDLAGVTERRKPEWIMNMALNPQEMLEKDPTAKELLGEYMTPMPNQNLTEAEARSILEFFRTKTKI